MLGKIETVCHVVRLIGSPEGSNESILRREKESKGNKKENRPHVYATLSRLRMVKASVFRTDVDGRIVCRSDGETLTFITEKSKEGTQ